MNLRWFEGLGAADTFADVTHRLVPLVLLGRELHDIGVNRET